MSVVLTKFNQSYLAFSFSHQWLFYYLAHEHEKHIQKLENI